MITSLFPVVGSTWFENEPRATELTNALQASDVSVTYPGGPTAKRLDVLASVRHEEQVGRFFNSYLHPGGVTQAAAAEVWTDHNIVALSKLADGTVRRNWYVGRWKGWQDTGIHVAADAEPSIVSSRFGDFHIFGRDLSTDRLVHERFDDDSHTLDPSSPSAWKTAERWDFDAPLSSDPTVVRGNGTVDVFATLAAPDAGGCVPIVHRRWTAATDTWSPATGWQTLGGSAEPGRRVGATEFVDGSQVHVFTKGCNSSVTYHRWSADGVHWSTSPEGAWQSSPWAAGALAGSPVAISLPGNIVVLMGTGPSGTLRYSIWNGTAWTGWIEIPEATCAKPVGPLSLASDRTGSDPPWSFQAYYRITGNRIGHCFTTGWGFGVFSFGQDIRIDGATGNPSATSWGNGRYDVFAPAGTTVAHQWYTRDVGWSPATGYEHLGQ